MMVSEIGKKPIKVGIDETAKDNSGNQLKNCECVMMLCLMCRVFWNQSNKEHKVLILWCANLYIIIE